MNLPGALYGYNHQLIFLPQTNHHENHTSAAHFLLQANRGFQYGPSWKVLIVLESAYTKKEQVYPWKRFVTEIHQAITTHQEKSNVA